MGIDRARPAPESAESLLRASEQLMRQIFDAVPGGLVHVSADGSIVHANRAGLEILGLSYDELTQKYTRDFETETIHEDGSPFPVEDYPVTRALATGLPQGPVTIGVRKPDGALSWAVFTAVPLDGAERGGPGGALVTFLDITRRKRDEQALAESEAELRALVESAPNIIFTTDLEQRIVSINRTVPGLAVEGVPGTSIYEFVPEAQRAFVREQLQRVLSEGVVVSYEAMPTGVAPGSWTVNAGPIRRDGAICGLIFVLTDLTELKRAERERAELERRLHQSQRLDAVGRLAGGVAHDFNSLLTVILGNADLLLLRGGPPEKWRKAMEDIREAGVRAANLTRQLLALGQRQVLAPRILDLSEVVLGVENILRRLLGAGIDLVVRRPPRPALVLADATQFEQVIVNLATNARDAMVSGGTLAIEIFHVSFAADDGDRPAELAPGDYVRLRVRDTGTGMDEPTRERMFEPFFTTKAAGTGLGMATVFGIVQQSNGRIVVRSERGAGTEVTIYLPAPPASAAASPQAAPASAEPPPAQPQTASRSRDSISVLLVEDEPALRQVVTRMLDSAGYSVTAAANVQDALRAVDQSARMPDVLLTDVVMPGSDGAQLAQELRRRIPALKVLFMSGYSDPRVDARALSRMDARFLQKPFTADTLLAAIEGVFQLSGYA